MVHGRINCQYLRSQPARRENQKFILRVWKRRRYVLRLEEKNQKHDRERNKTLSELELENCHLRN